MKQKKPVFYALVKDFNSKELKPIDVLSGFFSSILNDKDRLIKKKFTVLNNKTYKYDPVTTKEQLFSMLTMDLRYRYWGKCEYEFIIVDWPNKKHVSDSNPVKIDVYGQIEPNLDLIVDLVWNYLEPKIKK